jgi:branched-subunit amino acid transport protein
MVDMTSWLVILGMALVTYATRAVMLLMLRGTMTPLLRRWLGYVPVAVFTALIVPPLLLQARGTDQSLVLGPELLAGVVGGLVAWRVGNLLLTIGSGMATFWLLRWLGW